MKRILTFLLFVSASFAAAPDIAYVTHIWSVASGTAISDSCVNSGGAATSWAIDPAMTGNGIAFDTTTGKISGTTTGRLTLTSYMVIATNGDGSDTTYDTVTIKKPDIDYEAVADTAIVGTAFTDSCINSGDSADSIKAAAAFPAGLTITKTGTSQGKISGTPTTVTAKATYKSYAWLGGTLQDSALCTLTVWPALPNIAYSTTICSTLIAMTAKTVTSTGGAVDSFKLGGGVSYPSGVSISKTTGTISGTPADTASKQGRMIVAYNITGNDTTYDTTTFIFRKPILTYPNLYFVVGKATTLTPTESSGSLDSVKATAGTLPGGLSVTKATGVITGTATGQAKGADITLTCWNSSGNRTYKVNIQSVKAVRPNGNGYAKRSFQ